VRAAYSQPLSAIAALFDSIYVSFYKDLNSPCAGAMLLGSAAFVASSVVWRRRFGGSIVSMFPMAPAAAWVYVCLVTTIVVVVVVVADVFLIRFQQRASVLGSPEGLAHMRAIATAVGGTAAVSSGWLKLVPEVLLLLLLLFVCLSHTQHI
jgi:hypothetical protein